ncbi:hypothetical protein [Desulfogranum marinum]|uniref:hypothetical protein n=1 Tax=Desulfogranum marinum TaxID=453220 RepID=UPI0019659A22|nr:hypothetical protein [Desulfogranum marinum]MBM9512631.1 hypothetical protein [Desulfogranum marinum]
MDPMSLSTLLICFGGGVVGAALGGLFSFVICGLVVLVGCVVIMSGGSEFILLQVGLGPIFGPHVGGFVAGCVAVTYAAGVKKNLASATGKDILSPLVDTSWDVLIVGGVAAVIAHLLLQVLAKIPVINTFDIIALDVVIMQIAARAFFCQEMPLGNLDSIKKYGLLGTDKGSLSWVPWAASPSKLITIGLGVGLLSGGLAMGVKEAMVASGTYANPGGPVVPVIICWSLAAISLIALELGTGEIQKFPVWHCQSILSAIAFLTFDSILIAGVVGILAALLQELMARLFWNHGSNHIDPPACAIAVGTFIINMVSKVV